MNTIRIYFVNNDNIYIYIYKSSINCLVIYIYVCVCVYIYIYTYTHIQGVSQLVDITAGGDFPRLFDQKSSYKHVTDFGRLRSYDRFKLRR